jgi:hypothetical protein
VIFLNGSHITSNGAYKCCYDKKGVAYLLIMQKRQGSLKADYKALQSLKRAGFPVAECKLGYVKLGKKKRLAMVCEKFDRNFRAYSIHNTDLVHASVPVLQTALKSMKLILAVMKKFRRRIIDTQYLVCYTTGRVVISDPYELEYDGSKHPNDASIKHLKGAIKWLKTQIQSTLLKQSTTTK